MDMPGPEAEALGRPGRLQPEPFCIARCLVMDPALQLAPRPGAAEGPEFPRRVPV